VVINSSINSQLVNSTRNQSLILGLYSIGLCWRDFCERLWSVALWRICTGVFLLFAAGDVCIYGKSGIVILLIRFKPPYFCRLKSFPPISVISKIRDWALPEDLLLFLFYIIDHYDVTFLIIKLKSIEAIQKMYDWLICLVICILSAREVVHLFSFLCCHIMCLYVLSSMLWCPLRFPRKLDVRVVFTSSCL
jgi:hypothetical protein